MKFNFSFVFFLLGFFLAIGIFLLAFFRYDELDYNGFDNEYLVCVYYRNRIVEATVNSGYGGKCYPISEYKYYEDCFNKKNDEVVLNLFWYQEACR